VSVAPAVRIRVYCSTYATPVPSAPSAAIASTTCPGMWAGAVVAIGVTIASWIAPISIWPADSASPEYRVVDRYSRR